MKRTISVMVGHGSVNHNSRKFHAKNTDPERSHLNIDYCQENIKAVYHELFDEALKRYNEKQTRADRQIADYYEKIRSGKQEKPFHEIILQVGNKEDMSAASEDGQLAAAVLGEYMKDFQERNPNLRVFSAHLHMDEATPHLHIDFVPFTTGSKRGLDTRVSLKQALAAQGFHGGTRGDTEWSQWVRSEKEQILPEPGALETGRAYREKKVKPLLAQIVKVLRSLYRAYIDLKGKFERLQGDYGRVRESNERLSDRLQEVKMENKALRHISADYERVKRAFGAEKVEQAIEDAKRREAQEREQKRKTKRKFERGAR